MRERKESGAGTLNIILQAAEKVIIRDGVAKMTIETVAREAGLSKGGVLYHFATKEALIKNMVANLLSEFEADVEKHLADDQASAGAVTRSYVRATLDDSAANAAGDGRAVGQAFGAALIAALATNPALLADYQKDLERWRERLAADGLDGDRSLIIALAADGLWLHELLGVWKPSDEERQRITDELLRLASRDETV